MIKIMEEYHHYVPIIMGVLRAIILYGDGLSCERANDALNARSNGATASKRLTGLVPAVSDWHCRGIVMKVRINLSD